MRVLLGPFFRAQLGPLRHTLNREMRRQVFV